MFSAGKESARKLTRARILLKADENWTDAEALAEKAVGNPAQGEC